MTITLNHTIVPARDHGAAARFFAQIMGLTAAPAHKFMQVRVNEQLALDFMAVEDPTGVHLAFDVDPATFDGVLARLRELGVPYGNDPRTPHNGRIDHLLAPRGLYFADADHNLYEVMSPL
ncbi:VOC family protein [Microbispora sp. NPDC049125]|uniref:VOC family protein n=1 Tax=Microbispora sp. NPDC049125 TaxID=3154929 RepID=UPI003466A866